MIIICRIKVERIYCSNWYSFCVDYELFKCNIIYEVINNYVIIEIVEI